MPMLIRPADADFTQLREAWPGDVVLGNGFDELSDIYQLNRLTQQGLIIAVAIGEHSSQTLTSIRAYASVRS
jgi:hypothetical protein